VTFAELTARDRTKRSQVRGTSAKPRRPKERGADLDDAVQDEDVAVAAALEHLNVLEGRLFVI